MSAAVLSADLAYWAQSLLRVLGGLVAVLLPAGTIVYLFLFKMMSFMQSRLGPMEAGPYGSMQLFAEVGKWLQKEELQDSSAVNVSENEIQRRKDGDDVWDINTLQQPRSNRDVVK